MIAARSSWPIIALVGLLGACDSEGSESAAMGDEVAADDGEASEGGPTETGTVALRFEVGSNVRESMNLEDTLAGNIYGGIFLTADVSVTGPRDDAEQIAYVEAADIDLMTAMLTELSWTSEELPPGNYTFLGFFDVDASSIELEEKDPEDGDPVTLPTVNKFTIEAGGAAELTVRFDLIL